MYIVTVYNEYEDEWEEYFESKEVAGIYLDRMIELKYQAFLNTVFPLSMEETEDLLVNVFGDE
jgi:hypothetical protein